MENEPVQPGAIAPPFGNYSHAIEIPAGNRRLHISGQVGVMPNGKMAQGFEEQCEWAWRNLKAIVEEAGMAMSDLVKYTTFITRQEDVAAYRAIRDRFIVAPPPASTLLVVSGLASPDWLVEVEAIAAK